MGEQLFFCMVWFDFPKDRPQFRFQLVTEETLILLVNCFIYFSSYLSNGKWQGPCRPSLLIMQNQRNEKNTASCQCFVSNHSTCLKAALCVSVRCVYVPVSWFSHPTPNPSSSDHVSDPLPRKRKEQMGRERRPARLKQTLQSGSVLAQLSGLSDWLSA